MTFYPLLFLAILNFSVLANPVPPTPRDLDIYTELLPVEEPIALNDINDSEYAGCSPDTSTKKVSDNEAIDSNQNLNILRRLVPQVCPTGFLEKNPNGAKPPRTNKNPTPKPVDRSTQSGTTEQRCDDPEEPQLVSCGGKEMRDASNGDIWYVANCVPSKSPSPSELDQILIQCRFYRSSS